ncbi:hypothetical protein [Deinococcus ruber]|uniref:hypothetical protein n=1 Tax=Deinococcus ruber TaxID=1848197 RepID=UPI00166927A0|nr:hypothetical protein [Deinococcus ruber]
MGAFLELIIPLSFFLDDEVVDDRQDIEAALDQLLCEAGLGKVSGGGSGAGVAIIDIEIVAHIDIGKVIEKMTEIRQRFRLPDDTRIIQRQPHEQFSILSNLH